MREPESTENSSKPQSQKWGWKKLLQRLGLGRFFFRSLESEEDFHRLIDEGEEEGIIEEEEHELIHSVFEFGDTIVREVMVPRLEITAFSLKATLDEVLNIIIEKGHSRIPVYEQKMDNIVGIVYAKDLLKVFKSDKRDIVITDIMRPPYFVPETKKIMDLLKEFQGGHRCNAKRIPFRIELYDIRSYQWAFDALDDSDHLACGTSSRLMVGNARRKRRV